MNYQHINLIERYHIISLMKALCNFTQIAQLLGRDKSTMSSERHRNAGSLGCRAKHDFKLACKRSKSIGNASVLGALGQIVSQ
jgi:IS30 family transposase